MATLTLNLVHGNPGAPPTCGYIVRYRVKGSLGAYTTATFAAVGPFVITGLTEYTDYEGDIKSDCCTGSQSNPIQFNSSNYNMLSIQSTLAGVSVTGVVGVTGYSLPESVEFGETIDAPHGAFTGQIEIQLSGTPGVAGNLTVKKNGTPFYCSNLPNGVPVTTKYATLETYLSTDLIEIELNTGSCV